jgi:FkbM family methyltransferase
MSSCPIAGIDNRRNRPTAQSDDAPRPLSEYKVQSRKIPGKIRSSLKGGIKGAARALGVELTRYRPNSEAARWRMMFDALLNVRQFAVGDRADDHYRFIDFCRRKLDLSRSQLFQDLFVQYTLNELRNGFFVEFGATNGIDLSNTHLLENTYGWDGILAEPARGWQNALAANRKCKIDNRCVWHQSGATLEFNEAAELSTIRSFSDGDEHREARRQGTHYMVETISFNDLLAHHKAPARIQYLSIDTEGSEYSILKGFDFGRYDIRIITVEHNYSDPGREDIHALLTSKGYERKFPIFSKWDDWYVKRP